MNAYPGIESTRKDCGFQHLPQEEKHPPQNPWTAEAESLLQQRHIAILAHDSDLADTLTKQLRSQRRRDKKQHTLAQLNKEAAEAERWGSLKRLRATYTPQPYHTKKLDGSHALPHERPDAAAQYLATVQWGLPPPGHLCTHSSPS